MRNHLITCCRNAAASHNQETVKIYEEKMVEISKEVDLMDILYEHHSCAARLKSELEADRVKKIIWF